MSSQLSAEAKLFIESFGEDFSKAEVIEFLNECVYDTKELEVFGKELLAKLLNMNDEDFLKEMNTIN